MTKSINLLTVAILSSVLLSLFAFQISPSDCEAYYPMEEGTSMTTAQYDKKDKLTGKHTLEVKSVEETANGMKAEVHTDIYDDKGENINSSDYTIECEGNKFYIDMKAMINQEMMEAYKDMEVEMEGNQLQFPSTMKVGQSLPDAHIEMKLKTAGMVMSTITVNITNRKVEAKESVTTEAGTFDCYKISSDINTKAGKVMSVNTDTREVKWYAKNTGVVRSETYKENGKLQGYSELIELQRP